MKISSLTKETSQELLQKTDHKGSQQNEPPETKHGHEALLQHHVK
jgi:hypothetical protein